MRFTTAAFIAFAGIALTDATRLSAPRHVRKAVINGDSTSSLNVITGTSESDNNPVTVVDVTTSPCTSSTVANGLTSGSTTKPRSTITITTTTCNCTSSIPITTLATVSRSFSHGVPDISTTEGIITVIETSVHAVTATLSITSSMSLASSTRVIATKTATNTATVTLTSTRTSSLTLASASKSSNVAAPSGPASTKAASVQSSSTEGSPVLGSSISSDAPITSVPATTLSPNYPFPGNVTASVSAAVGTGTTGPLPTSSVSLIPVSNMASTLYGHTFTVILVAISHLFV